ncbi:hypothetical protein ACFQ1L_43355 [Phytohabitans flavus]
MNDAYRRWAADGLLTLVLLFIGIGGTAPAGRGRTGRSPRSRTCWS